MPERLSFVVTCKGRLEYVKRTIVSARSQPDSDYIFVDYSDPDDAGSWIRRNYPEAKVIFAPGRSGFNWGDALNRGAAEVTTNWVCFLDADVHARPGFVQSVQRVLVPGNFLACPEAAGLAGTLICHADDWKRAKFDDEKGIYAGVDTDFKIKLALLGLHRLNMPVNLLWHEPHGNELRVQYYDEKDFKKSRDDNKARLDAKREVWYRGLKNAT